MDKSLARCAYLLKGQLCSWSDCIVHAWPLAEADHCLRPLPPMCFPQKLSFPHFLYLQKGDAQAGRAASFIACNCVVHYYLMVTQLQNSLRNNKWKEQNEYKDVVSAVSNCGEDEMKVLQEKR